MRGVPNVPSVLLGLRSGKDSVRVEALCFAGVRHGYIYVRISKPTDWRFLDEVDQMARHVVGDIC